MDPPQPPPSRRSNSGYPFPYIPPDALGILHDSISHNPSNSQHSRRQSTNRTLILPTASAVYNLKNFDQFVCEIETYTSPSALDTFRRLRETLQDACHVKGIDYTNVRITVPQHAIPAEAGSLVFANHIFSNGAGLIAFLAPQDGETIWFHWAGDRFDKNTWENLIGMMVRNGKLQLKDTWVPGTEPYKKFWKLCEKAVYEFQHPDTSKNRKANVLTVPYRALAKAQSEGQDVNVPDNFYRPIDYVRVKVLRMCLTFVDAPVMEATTCAF
ncbi:hypothetical protein K432DRAFT_396673 [Lepidopterella palustris CBS 459.81]|uniref:Uncharacterized protein n=1 Tax=Lepidopterella palustris CBS 459.81 TaxID=1314670 RepID=A0A8E2E2U2_9PEZI|nr:hypothetical protein K432DRAFT_396673 [Lepidopterella palustris CBS 459.81]